MTEKPKDDRKGERWPLKPELQEIREQVKPHEYAHASAREMLKPNAKKRPPYSLT